MEGSLANDSFHPRRTRSDGERGGIPRRRRRRPSPSPTQVQVDMPRKPQRSAKKPRRRSGRINPTTAMPDSTDPQPRATPAAARPRRSTAKPDSTDLQPRATPAAARPRRSATGGKLKKPFTDKPGEDSPSACESQESDDVQITRGLDYVLPSRCELSDAEEKRVAALMKEIKPEVTVIVAKITKSSFQYVTIPKEYADVPNSTTTITLGRPGNNKKWHPNFYEKKNMSKLTGEWRLFWRDNALHEGDICIFVPAEGGKPCTFTVHLLRKETTDSETEVSHESSECEDSHGQPPYILPYGVYLTSLAPPERSAVKKILRSIQPEVPICVSIMRASNVGSRPKLELSKRFAAEHLPPEGGTLIFQYEEKIWNINMAFHPHDKRWYLIGGWPGFIADNSLQKGDICLFELTKDKKTVIVHLVRKCSSGGSPVLDSNNVRASTMIDHRRKRCKTSVISSASEQSGEETGGSTSSKGRIMGTPANEKVVQDDSNLSDDATHLCLSANDIPCDEASPQVNTEEEEVRNGETTEEEEARNGETTRAKVARLEEQKLELEKQLSAERAEKLELTQAIEKIRAERDRLAKTINEIIKFHRNHVTIEEVLQIVG